MPTTAYSYIRFSTPEQSKGDSLRRQLDASQDYIAQHPELNLVLDTTLNMRDLGVSAYRGDNATSGAFGTFLAAIDGGHVVPGSYLLVESLDRLSRADVMETALPLFISIVNKGIIIVTLMDKKIYSKESIKKNPFNLMYSIMIMIRANEESDTKSDRVGKAWGKKRNRATTDNHKLTSVCPLWLELKGKEFVIIPDRVQLVQRMYQMCLDGHGPMSIAQQLNREGVATWTSRDGWYRDYVRKILLTPAVYGVFTPGKRLGKHKRAKLEPIPDYFPAIISEETFFETQHAIAKRRTKGGRPGDHVNILSALLQCAKCHGPIVRLNRGNQATPLFVCAKGRQGVSDCAYAPWPVSEVEEKVLTHMTELDVSALFSSDEETKLKSIRSSIAATQAAIARTQSDLTRLEDFAIKEELSAGLNRRMKSMEVEIAGYEAKLSELEEQERKELSQRVDATVAVERIQSLRSDDDPLMRVKLQSEIRNLVEQIVVHLPARKISVRYTVKDFEQKARIVMSKGKRRSIDMNGDMLPE